MTARWLLQSQRKEESPINQMRPKKGPVENEAEPAERRQTWGRRGQSHQQSGGLLANTEDGHSAMCLVSTIVYTASLSCLNLQLKRPARDRPKPRTLPVDSLRREPQCLPPSSFRHAILSVDTAPVLTPRSLQNWPTTLHWGTPPPPSLAAYKCGM